MFSIFCFPCQFWSRLLDEFAWLNARNKTKQEDEEELLGKLCPTDPKQRNRGLILVGVVFSLVQCAFAVLLWVCCCWSLRSSVRLSSILWASGAWIGLCVCLFLSQARALSLTVFRFSHTVSISRNFFFLPSYLLWSPPQFDYFYQKVLSLLCFFVCFLLPLICNNSCILRDATVCVFVVCTVQKREVCPIFPACRLRVCVWGCDSFYLQ